MADITSLVTIKGGSQDATRPFDWHVWDITVPASALAGAGPDDIILPDRFRANTRLLDLRTQVLTLATVGTTLLMDIEYGLRADANGAISGLTNIVTGIDLELETTRLGVLDTNAVVEDFGDSVDGTNRRIINLELTRVGAVSGADCRFLVAALIGRVEF